MFGIGPVELAVVLVVALLVMGPKKLPQLARTLGKGLAEFRRASNDLKRSFDMDMQSHEVNDSSAPAQAGSPHAAPQPGTALEEIERGAARSDEPAPLDDEAEPPSEDPQPDAEPMPMPVPASGPKTETPGD